VPHHAHTDASPALIYSNARTLILWRGDTKASSNGSARQLWYCWEGATTGGLSGWQPPARLGGATPANDPSACQGPLTWVISQFMCSIYTVWADQYGQIWWTVSTDGVS
jgi:hypothetical protein